MNSDEGGVRGRGITGCLPLASPLENVLPSPASSLRLLGAQGLSVLT